jgi:hypothetical protein
VTVKTGHCECGCGHVTGTADARHAKDGYAPGDRLRFIHGHNGRAKSPGYEVRDCGYRTPCWIWMGWTNPRGYGRGKLDGKRGAIHRLYYEREHGPVSPSLQIDHLCCVRTCVNPDHLEPVTPRENTRRSRVTKLTRDEAAVIKGSTDSRASLARRFGVSPATIYAVRQGINWRDVEPIIETSGPGLPE